MIRSSKWTRGSHYPELLEHRLLLASDLLITELMARNNSGPTDQDAETSDWIEIQNRSVVPVDLNGWYLTDAADNLAKWRIGLTNPDADTPLESLLKLGDYRVIFASGKDRRSLGAELHTNFKLDGDGEFLALVQPDGTTIAHQFAFPKQVADFSYGLKGSDATQPVYFRTPTPGAANAEGFLGFVADTTFNGNPQIFHGRGFYNTPFDVKLTTATPGATVSYTTNGSVPSADNGTIVSAPDVQTLPIATVRITGTTTLRTMAFKEGYESTNVDTQTYIFADDVVRQPTEPEGFPNFRHKDLHATPDGTFLIDLPEGAYTLKITLGDQRQVRDEMTIHVQGQEVDTLTTDANEFLDRIYQIEVSDATNGQLALRLEDRGGVTDRAVINSLVITPDHGGPSTLLDFGGRSSLVQPGFTKVRETDTYSPKLGLGWQAGTEVVDLNREPGGDLVYFGMNPDIVDDNRDTIVDDLKSLPTLSLVGNVEGWFGTRGRGIFNYSQRRGRGSERAISIEYFDPNQPDRQFQIDAGVRIQGNHSRIVPQKNLRLYFRSEYDSPKLRFPLYPDSTVDEFERITLGFAGGDNSSQSATFARERFVHQSVLDMGQPEPHGLAIHVYINGLYWGLYWATERPDHSFAASYFGGDEDEWDSIKFGTTDGLRAVHGNTRAWNKMMSIRNLALDANYERMQQYLDIDNFIDHTIAALHFGNIDNWEFYAARRRAEGEGFKFFHWDADESLFSLGTNLTNLDFANHPTGLLTRLAANDQFRQRFADRVQRHLFNDGALTIEGMQVRWQRITDQINQAIVPESARWTVVPGNLGGSDYSRDQDWRPEVKRVLKEVIPDRFDLSLGYFRDAGLFPVFDAPVFNQHGGTIEPGFRLSMAGRGIIYYTQDGTDPTSRIVTVDSVTLLDEKAPARTLIPRDGSLGITWTELGFDDSQWTAGVTGIGFDAKAAFDPLIGLDVESQMKGSKNSAYVRIPFEVADPNGFAKLVLRMKYDDGFLAYINGVEVARRNAPTVSQWNSRASRFRLDSDATKFEDVDILIPSSDLLKPGTNVLAIHGLNQNIFNDDFVIMPRLEARIITDEGLSASAMRYSGSPIPIAEDVVVKARALVGTQWSTLNKANFTVGFPSLRGDWDRDGQISVSDIDRLSAQVNAPTPPIDFDLTGDGLVDHSDLDELVRSILGTNYGDMNLDGVVDALDFQTFANNFGSNSAGWETGDSDGDGDVDFADFVRLTNNFGFS